MTDDDADRCLELGHLLSQRGRWQEAEAQLRRAVTLAPDLSMAHNNLGWVRQMQGDLEEAVTCYCEALRLAPMMRMTRRNLAPLLVRLGRVEESLELWHSELLAGDEGVAWVDELISSAIAEPDLTVAGRYAAIFARLRWGATWPAPRNAAATRPTAATPPLFLSIPKLHHDIEQFEYLKREHVLGSEITHVIAEYQRIIERLAPHGDEARVPLDSDAHQRIGAIYNRMIHVRETPRVTRALSSRWQAASVEEAYIDRPPGVVIVDDFLSRDALDGLQRFCLESTVWSANRYGYGRLGAFLRDGFNCPLLLQIAEELRDALPCVIGARHPLRQLWGFKNGHKLPPDATTHADFAAVNVNFWITPDEANLEPTGGGLIVHAVDAPLDWDFYAYNGRADLIRAYLQRHQARRIEIPYRCNRAVIFNSDLFHSTAELRFRLGYEHRRVNITMLYGHRENDVHHGHLVRAGARDLVGDVSVPTRRGWRSASFGRTRSH